MDTEQKKTSQPIYLPLPKLDKLMQLLTQRKLDKVTASYFQSYGFAESDSYLAISSIRFLGLIDDNGNATEQAKRLHLTGDAGKKEVEKIVRSSYSKLFKVTDKPFDLPVDELINEFIHNYDMSLRLARPAASAFLRLCEHANLVPEGKVQVRAVKTSNTSQTSSKKEKKENFPGRKKQDIEENISIEGKTQMPIGAGEIILILPNNILTKAVLNGDMQDIVKKLSEFSSKYIPEENN